MAGSDKNHSQGGISLRGRGMRLGKRLFLQIFIIYLIIFQSFFLYTIYQTHEANKKDIIEYEMKLFSAKNNEYMNV